MTKKVLAAIVLVACVAVFYFINTGKNMFTQKPVPVPEIEQPAEQLAE